MDSWTNSWLKSRRRVTSIEQFEHRLTSSEDAAAAAPQRISLAKLPSSSPLLVGHDRELALLDDTWADPHTHIVEFVAWGGVGKTTLVNKWLAGLAAKELPPDAVFGWSILQPGRGGREARVGRIRSSRRRCAGLATPTRTPAARGTRGSGWLSGCCRERTLLVLDGLEPLQYPPGELGGRLRDPGMASLLR